MSQPDMLETFNKVADKQEASRQAAAAAAEESTVLESEEQEEAESAFTEATGEDALDLLMSAEPAVQIQKIELDPRKGTDKPFVLVLKSLDEKQWDSLRDAAEVPMNRAQRRKAGSNEPQIDNALFARLIIKASTQNLDWNDKNLRQRFGVNSGEDVIRKVLLYGESANVAGIVTQISGFDEELVRFSQDL